MSISIQEIKATRSPFTHFNCGESMYDIWSTVLWGKHNKKCYGKNELTVSSFFKELAFREQNNNNKTPENKKLVKQRSGLSQQTEFKYESAEKLIRQWTEEFEASFLEPHTYIRTKHNNINVRDQQDLVLKEKIIHVNIGRIALEKKFHTINSYQKSIRNDLKYITERALVFCSEFDTVASRTISEENNKIYKTYQSLHLILKLLQHLQSFHRDSFRKEDNHFLECVPFNFGAAVSILCDNMDMLSSLHTQVQKLNHSLILKRQ